MQKFLYQVNEKQMKDKPTDRLVAIPLTRQKANEFIREHHRHHKPVLMDIFRVAAWDGEKIVGVAQVGHPVARMLTDGKTVEVVRLCVLDGVSNACSFLYSRCARIAKEMGYRHIVTYVYATEPGTSLKASGWQLESVTKGASWSVPSRPRKNELPIVDKHRWGRYL